MMKKLIIYALLFFLTFIVVSLLALPILFDLIFSIFILFIFRKNYPSIIVLNFLIVMVVFIIDVTFGKNEKYGYFYRGHEKYKTKNFNYQKNISDIIFMPHGDIYFIDGGLNKKRELIKEPREQQFITDSYGFRNDSKIENAEIILVGDSFIAGTGTTHQHLPANVLSKISGKKVASLSYARLGPKEYEMIINKYLDIIKKDAKIFVFYFEGNDFKKNSKQINKKEKDGSQHKYLVSYKIRSGYERLEKNKDKFLLQILSEKNYFLRNIRAKSHTIIKKFFSRLHNTIDPIKYYQIGDETVGFAYTDILETNNDYTSYIFTNNRIIERVNGIFFIPIKLRVYSDHINSITHDRNPKLEYLKFGYSKLNMPVYDLSEKMKPLVSKYLSEGKYLYWRDDTHWNHYGIFEAMNYTSTIIKKLP